jgi:hypothetical protein
VSKVCEFKTWYFGLALSVVCIVPLSRAGQHTAGDAVIVATFVASGRTMTGQREVSVSGTIGQSVRTVELRAGRPLECVLIPGMWGCASTALRLEIPTRTLFRFM